MVKVERFQPAGLDIRMQEGKSAYSHVVTVTGPGKLVYTAGQLARDAGWVIDWSQIPGDVFAHARTLAIVEDHICIGRMASGDQENAHICATLHG